MSSEALRMQLGLIVEYSKMHLLYFLTKLNRIASPVYESSGGKKFLVARSCVTLGSEKQRSLKGHAILLAALETGLSTEWAVNRRTTSSLHDPELSVDSSESRHSNPKSQTSNADVKHGLQVQKGNARNSAQAMRAERCSSLIAFSGKCSDGPMVLELVRARSVLD